MREKFGLILISLFFILLNFNQAVFAQKIEAEIFETETSEKPIEQENYAKIRENLLAESRNKFAPDELETKKPDDTIQTNNIYGLKRGDKEFAVEYGISPFNPSNFAGPKEFDVYGRDLHLFTFRFGRIIGTKKNVSYQYMFGVTPLAVFTKNEVVNPEYVSPTATPNVAPTMRETSYGFGFQPVNFKFIFLAKNRLKPYAQVGAGILFTNKSVPVPRSTLFQATGDFGGGLMYMLSPKRAVSLGYKYFHISNLNINGKINNPGFNANVFYINYSFFWKRK